jgi:RecB family exonuclease
LIPIRPTPEPAARHLSYSALATYGRCGYRFFVERVLGLPARDDRARDGGGGRERFGFGNAVHAALEWSARHGWREPDPALYEELLRREQVEPAEAELDRARAMIAAWLDSELCREVRARRAARPEMPFILRLGDSVVRGTMDLYAAGEMPLVVDYKTDSVRGELDELIDRYGVQRKIYALAAAGDAPSVRTAYVFLERPDEPIELELDRAALAAARSELEELISGIRESRFEVTVEPHAALCWDCPARARLCSHPTEMTDRRLG